MFSDLVVIKKFVSGFIELEILNDILQKHTGQFV